ncbi:pilus assembly protein CpaF [Thermanaeromonas toyohensis ToBE]|uniref:Pilus assembly protein CpaF n=1 Tax=Thermanaeromonas toyohensis ToBE TaxID=698762 RepID=A0A1W1VND8_9FIRM|nr:CpaF family protein [Thermanaeromonas toyohensis]SMB94879.1 pilus assembly protein CpaF [Thermanaeromonas toyohensis ToBE]
MSLLARLQQKGETRTPDNKKDPYGELKQLVHQRIIEELKEQPLGDGIKEEELANTIEHRVLKILEEMGTPLPRPDCQRLAREITDDTIAWGPITPLLKDPEISEIMVNGPDQVYVERRGKLERTEVKFRDASHVMHIIEKIVAPLGRRIDESVPMVDARLPDGSRVNAVIPPISLNGPVLTIRKFFKDPLKIQDLIQLGTLTPQMAFFLEACVKGRLNIIVSGGTGSGKTTTLNVLSSFIPEDERIITIEDAAELQLRQEHVITLESRPPNIEGRGAITIRDLVRNALRMRPDRIVVGEVRSGEALDMLQAMNTGHDGSLTTGHANSPRDMLSRLETMVLMAGMDLPVRAIREQIASAIDLIIHQSRFKDGSRKITHITEVVGMEGEVITLQDIFLFQQEGYDSAGRVRGRFVATGIRPRFLHKLEARDIKLPPEIFAPGY